MHCAALRGQSDGATPAPGVRVCACARRRSRGEQARQTPRLGALRPRAPCTVWRRRRACGALDRAPGPSRRALTRARVPDMGRRSAGEPQRPLLGRRTACARRCGPAPLRHVTPSQRCCYFRPRARGCARGSECAALVSAADACARPALRRAARADRSARSCRRRGRRCCRRRCPAAGEDALFGWRHLHGGARRRHVATLHQPGTSAAGGRSQLCTVTAACRCGAGGRRSFG
mmetsp:Transcript_1938/g.6408  ORF Transcript_1938/g.6408 Transcript_1938/m.6408 type:complete len:232 (+) Transcript_1938:626-1321(+)